MVLDNLSEEWLFDRDQQENAYKGYQQCKESKEDTVYCRSVLSHKSPPPPPRVQDAPSYVIQDNTFKRIALFSFGGALLSGLLGAAIYFAGRALQNSARREDPSRVVIGHSRALEILVWIGAGFFGTIAIVKGLAGRSAEAAPFVAVGLAAFAFIIIFQLVLYVFRPSEADAEGLRLGFGRRLRWKDFQQKTSVTVKRQNRTVSFYYKLHVKNGSVSVDPATTSNFERLKRFINEGVGRDVV